MIKKEIQSLPNTSKIDAEKALFQQLIKGSKSEEDKEEMRVLLASLDEPGLIPTEEDLIRLGDKKKLIRNEFPFAEDLLKSNNWIIESCSEHN